ncbi:hypothetical protein LNN31_18510 [Acetobacterium wieringae]|uniref:Uncharacterized protein n=1 Tax=Acetobacterium wieringae TaxID=52694 RepID=A0ABY6HE45_9FIRM|nr:hypothetical protein [Acetobacterium wieringae]UYO62740.1 hypothetical protein LNN31_18510 [Acetobacterium wieringae]VUZ27842.1 Uncharacterised protein [Acetobacterium wieringae]
MKQAVVEFIYKHRPDIRIDDQYATEFNTLTKSRKKEKFHNSDGTFDQQIKDMITSDPHLSQ